MLCIKLKKQIFTLIAVFLLSSVLFAVESHAASSGLFSDLIAKGTEIFNGMKEIIYAVSGFGIIAVAVGGIFGNFNWKWLCAIIIGLMVIAGTAGLIEYLTGQRIEGVTDTLK